MSADTRHLDISHHGDERIKPRVEVQRNLLETEKRLGGKKQKNGWKEEQRWSNDSEERKETQKEAEKNITRKEIRYQTIKKNVETEGKTTGKKM